MNGRCGVSGPNVIQSVEVAQNGVVVNATLLGQRTAKVTQWKRAFVTHIRVKVRKHIYVKVEPHCCKDLEHTLVNIRKHIQVKV